MPLSPTRLAEVLRATLLEVEQTSGVPADDPAMVKLKSILVRRIADVEAERLVEEAMATGQVAPVEGMPAVGATEETPAPVDPKLGE